ncbi:MAG: hypothetical protein LBR60_09810 [Fibrobacter sp.]|nr:hypothetical protein [Fibrobacter sp.]
MPKTQINLDGWQDYRGTQTGALLYVETSHQSAVPVRDQLNENGKGFFYEPNYETSTYDFVSCYNVKNINTIVKNKNRYILFGTRYEGASVPELKNKYLITGYMRIDKIKDVRSRHLEKFMSSPGADVPECMNIEKCWAIWGLMRFTSLEDSFMITDELLKEWGYKGRASRQLKTVFNKEHLEIILAHLDSKPDMIDEYIATVDEYKEVLLAEEE